MTKAAGRLSHFKRLPNLPAQILQREQFPDEADALLEHSYAYREDRGLVLHQENCGLTRGNGCILGTSLRRFA